MAEGVGASAELGPVGTQNYRIANRTFLEISGRETVLLLSHLGLARCQWTAEGLGSPDPFRLPRDGHAPPRARPAPEVGFGGFGALLKSREFGPRTRPSPCCGMSSPLASRRTREEVDATLQVAKLNAAELLPTVHCLSFGPGTGGAAAGDFCLLELDPALCQQLEAGDR